MDPLSDVFGLLQVKAVLSARFEAGGDWAVRFAPQPQIKFSAALRGRCWLILHGGEPCRLEAGDTYLMTNSPAYVLASDPSQPPVDGSALYASAEGNAVHYIGDDTVLLGGSFLFDESNAALLMDVLPALIHIPADNPASKVLRETLHLLDDELGAHRMSTSIVTSRLGDILLIQALRAYVASRAPAGWLGALVISSFATSSLPLLGHLPSVLIRFSTRLPDAMPIDIARAADSYGIRLMQAPLREVYAFESRIKFS